MLRLYINLVFHVYFSGLRGKPCIFSFFSNQNLERCCCKWNLCVANQFCSCFEEAHLTLSILYNRGSKSKTLSFTKHPSAESGLWNLAETPQIWSLTRRCVREWRSQNMFKFEPPWCLWKICVWLKFHIFWWYLWCSALTPQILVKLHRFWMDDLGGEWC